MHASDDFDLPNESAGTQDRITSEPSQSGSARAAKYQLETVWPTPSEAVCDEIVNFWLTEGALPDRQSAADRARQLLVVARDESGNVAGVSTVFPTHVKRLGFACFYYRTFVGRGHRSIGLRSTRLWQQILLESYRALNERFRAGHDPEVLGIYMEIENPTVMRTLNEAIWNDRRMNVVFIGKTPAGHHVRPWYFEGARIV